MAKADRQDVHTVLAQALQESAPPESGWFLVKRLLL